MAEVIKNPRVLRRIQEELDSVIGCNRMVAESDLPHLPYLRCVVRESFQMHPAGPFLIPHESLKPTTIMGYHIPAQTRVLINTHALGRNPRIWDDVNEFRPERHLPEGGGRVEISHLPDFKILPFSAGKRKCPGAPLGRGAGAHGARQALSLLRLVPTGWQGHRHRGGLWDDHAQGQAALRRRHTAPAATVVRYLWCSLPWGHENVGHGYKLVFAAMAKSNYQSY
jgi:cytochrome P450